MVSSGICFAYLLAIFSLCHVRQWLVDVCNSLGVHEGCGVKAQVKHFWSVIENHTVMDRIK